MVRNFEQRPVPADVLDRILDNALRAPSAGFSQGWAFLVLDTPDDTTRFWLAAQPERGFAESGWPGVYDAPVVIVPMSHKQAYLDRYAAPDKGWQDRAESRWPSPFWEIDTGFASLLMLLSAVDAGLGALFFGVTRIAELRDAFGLPDEYHPIGAIALGYAAPDVKSPSLKRGKRPRTEVVHRGRWGVT